MEAHETDFLPESIAKAALKGVSLRGKEFLVRKHI
jgi:hypothetical protein